MFDESCPDKRQFRNIHWRKNSQTIKYWKSRELRRQVTKPNEMKGHLRYIIQKLIKAMCGNFALGNKWNKNTLKVEEYTWTDWPAFTLISYWLEHMVQDSILNIGLTRKYKTRNYGNNNQHIYHNNNNILDSTLRKLTELFKGKRPPHQ